MPPLIPDSESDEIDEDNNCTHHPLPNHTTRPIQFADPGHLRIFDIRSAKEDHDGSDTDSEPAYWPERLPPSPPRPSSPPPFDANTTRISSWTNSQLPWSTYRYHISDPPITSAQLSGPPSLHRLTPNYHYLRTQPTQSTDTLRIADRLRDFHHSPLSWSEYILALPPITRRHYQNMPPVPSSLDNTDIPSDNNDTDSSYIPRQK